MMCAKLLKHKTEAQQGRFYRSSQRVFDRVISFYGRTLTWVLNHQRPTLWVAVGTLVLTISLVLFRAQRLFSRPGHRGYSGNIGSASIDFLCGHGRTAAGPCPGDPQGPGG